MNVRAISQKPKVFKRRRFFDLQSEMRFDRSKAETNGYNKLFDYRRANFWTKAARADRESGEASNSIL